MKRIRILLPILTICLLTAVIAACSSSGPGKENLLQALAKHEDIVSSAYSGNLNLDIQSQLWDGSQQPYTATLLTSLQQGSIAWQGVQARDVERREADIRITTSDGSFTFTIPFIQESENLYLHIPFVNLDGEYFQVPAAGPLEDINAALRQAFMRFVENMEAGWFTVENQDDDGELIVLTITDANWLSFLKKVNDAFPEVINEFQRSQLLTEAQAAAANEQWRQLATHWQDIKLAEGTEAIVRTTVNEQGFITGMEASMSLTTQLESDQSDKAHTNSFHLQLSWEQINEQANFKKEIPELFVEFSELLALIP